MILASLKDTIAHHQLSTKKKLGQHFLTDPQLLAKIVRVSGVGKETHVIEIGSGPGGLTRALLGNNIASVTALELDDRCLPILAELQSYDARLRVIHGDALKYPLQELCPAPRAVVANLPYNVGTQIVIHYLRAIETHGAEVVDSMTVMLQKEVADRMCAAPNTSDYGKLSVLCQWLCDVSSCFDVPPSAFSPPPKVMSSVVRLVPRSTPMFNVPLKKLEQFLAAAFGQRRKMLRGALKGYCETPELWLEAAGIDPTRRAETLTLAEIGKMLSNDTHL